MASDQTESYAENYARIKEIAAQLRDQQEPDIDQLVPMVEQANAAYRVCKTRLDAVKKALAEMLGNDEPKDRSAEPEAS